MHKSILAIGLIGTSLVGLSGSSADAATVQHKAKVIEVAKTHHQVRRQASAQKPRLVQEALWPIYFYGCDDGSTDCE